MKVFEASRLKAAGFLALSLLFVALGVWIVGQTDEGAWKGWLAIGFFGLGLPIFGLEVIRPMRLTLDDAGFTLSGGLYRRPKRVAWSEVESFYVYSAGRGGKMIGYNFRTDGARPRTWWTKASRAFGADAALPRLWREPPEVIVAELNAWRERRSRS